MSPSKIDMNPEGDKAILTIQGGFVLSGIYILKIY
jgi:hypothetical protein